MKINLDQNKKYLLACSYGPDSMCLFDILKKNGFSFCVANVNYNLRAEGPKEQSDLRLYCEKNNIKFYGLEVKEQINKNIEEKCREIRYDFFKKIYENNGFDALLVAHNQDDVIETYLLQVKRKSLVKSFGLSFESEVKGMKVLRPLLDYTKESLKKYDDENAVPYAIDLTNFENKFERNKIRNTMVKNMNSFGRRKILKEIDMKNAKRKQISKKLMIFTTNKIVDVLKLDETSFSFYLTKLARDVVDDIEFSKNRINEFRKILISEKPNVLQKIKGDFYFVKAYSIFGFKKLPLKTNFCFILEKPGILDTDYFYLNFTLGAIDRNVRNEDYPLYIRNASKDDVITIKGYKTSMRREFINWKMPLEIRDRWPVIENKNHEIIYVPRYREKFPKLVGTNFYVKI